MLQNVKLKAKSSADGASSDQDSLKHSKGRVKKAEKPGVESANSSGGTANVRAVERALDILKAFNTQRSSMTATELAQAVNLSRPTLYRLLKTLEKNEFVISSGEPLKFSLGPAIAQMGHVWTSTSSVSDIAQPILENLRKRTGETVALFLLEGQYRVCIAELPSQHPLNYKMGVGYKELITVGASGRAILAFAPSSSPFESRQTASTNHKKVDLKKELSQIQEKGYAISQQELIEGAVAIAAPFFKNTKEVVGSIAVFGPSVRFKKESIASYTKQLLQAAKELSKAMGAKY